MPENSTISFYCPSLSSKQMVELDFIRKSTQKYRINEIPIKKSWQFELCSEMGLKRKTIPWSQLRALHFDIGNDIQTMVCCDPVMMQMTHRGAYLWGQSQIEFSNDEAIKIIAQINQQLMGEDECFYLLNNKQWLYTNKKKIELNQASYDEYIGKDMFGFSYSGSNGIFWDKLATEIQMLIKQMIDYQGLTPVAPEMMINVHFWGNTNNKLTTTFEKVNNPKINVLSSDTLIELFCKKSQIKVENLHKFEEVIVNLKKQETNKIILIVLENENIDIYELINNWVNFSNRNRVEHIRLVFYDKALLLNEQQSLWYKITKYFR